MFGDIVDMDCAQIACIHHMAPLSPGFNLDRYDRELRRPFPSAPQFAPGSEIWRREHAIGDAARPAVPGRDKVRPATTSRARSLEFQ